MDQERKIVLHCSKTCIRMMSAALDIILCLEAVTAKNTHDRNLYASIYNLLKMLMKRKPKFGSCFKFVMTRNPLESILLA